MPRIPEGHDVTATGYRCAICREPILSNQDSDYYDPWGRSHIECIDREEEAKRS